MLLQTRTYGTSGPQVVLLHGGPAAPGYLAPLARQLADAFRVVEPFQRGSGPQPLSVARHVADLDELLGAQCANERPALVGHSWGAMLALAYAAEHSDTIAALVLVGCGTFDPASRSQLEATRQDRMDEQFQSDMTRLQTEVADVDQRLKAIGRLFQRIDSHELIAADDETLQVDARAYEETWTDMLRLQQEGVYPEAFANIRVPTLMLHGTVDPHPGQMIAANLKAYLPQLEYREWPRCGHHPWLEKNVRNEFVAVLRQWLLQHTTTSPRRPATDRRGKE